VYFEAMKQPSCRQFCFNKNEATCVVKWTAKLGLGFVIGTRKSNVIAGG